MINILMENLSTIVVGGLVFTLIVKTSLKIIKDKKNGIGSCGHSCKSCPSSGGCHTE